MNPQDTAIQLETLKPGRNFAIHIPEDKKTILKELAKASGMSLAQYVETILNRAAQKGEVYELQAKLVKSGSLPVASRN